MFAHYKIGILFALCAFYFAFIHSQGLGLGGSCYVPTDCGLWHFICDKSVCKCDKDHIPDRDNKWCAVDILKPCGYHDTCYDIYAECQDVAIPKYGSCKCRKGFTLHKEKMICSTIIGKNCTITEDCIEGTCSNKTCICNKPLQSNINGTKCLPALHDDCSAFKECAKENAICNSQSKCVCANNYKEAKRDKEVFCLAMLGNKCVNQTDCADIGAECVAVNQREKIQTHTIKYGSFYSPYAKKEPVLNKTCVCGPGYVQNPKVSECLKIATELHGNCTEDIQCTKYSGFGSECKNKKCECKPGFYFDVDFDRCVRSCLCDGVSKDISDIKSLMKDLKPLIETMAQNNNVDATRLLRKIQRL